ncbi:MAG: ribonuclease P protein component [Hyphomicrobiaceae bacterium]|nr:ribonuclease P protein component [Hyphomicrobiaceae bacterium]
MTTLKRRAEFLRVRGGPRWGTPALVVEAKPRAGGDAEAGGEAPGARLGFTVSKKVGRAVVRNRIRRRLKAAARELMALAHPGVDYVIIARPAAVDRPYAELKADLAQALARVHRAAEARRLR